MMPTCRRWLTIACLITLGATVRAQFQPPLGMPTTPRGRPTMAPPPSEPIADPSVQPRFRTRAEVIEVTVIATDKDGRFVGDLKAEDFTLLEEGAKQTISTFALVDIPVPPASTSTSAPASPSPTAPASPALAPAPLRDVATSALAQDTRLFVLVLDALHTERRRSQVVRKQARAFIEQHVGASDLVAVITCGDANEKRLDFTRDRSRLFQLLDQFDGIKLQSATVERDADARLGGGSALREGRDPSDGERYVRARASMDTLAQVARFLSTVPQRRKSLLFFSEGIDYNVADIMGNVQRYASEVAKTVASAISAATRANVTFYAIDPRGLASGDTDLLETPVYHTVPRVSLSEPGVRGEFAESIRSLRTLAEGTGGFAAVDVNDVSRAFDRILRENSAYYVLGYQPAKPAREGEYRTIAVKTSRPGVTIVARKGYLTAREPEPPALDGRPAKISPELSTLLTSPLPNPGLPMRVHAAAFKRDAAPATAATPATKETVQIVVEIDGDALSFQQKDRRFDETIELALATVDARGRGANGTATTIGLRLTPEQFERARLTGIRWLSRIDLEPGRHQLRVAARAAGSARRGVVIADVDVPVFDTARLALSGVTLTSLPSVLAITSGDPSRLATLPSPPTATRGFVTGDRITAVAEVYPRAANDEIVEVRAFVDPAGPVSPASTPATGASSSDRTSAQPAPTTAGDSGSASRFRAVRRVVPDVLRDGREEVGFTFGTDSLAPGSYVLRLVARGTNAADGPGAAGDRSDPTERRIPFDIVAR